MSGFLVMVAAGVIAVAMVGYVLTYLTFLKKVGPNEVLVVSGRGKVKFITGGADMVIPLFQTYNRLCVPATRDAERSSSRRGRGRARRRPPLSCHR